MPVTVVHRDDSAGTNKLDAARQALRAQIAAGEQAERLLEEAQPTMAHERQIKDERQAIERQLEEERAARQQAE